MVAHKLNISEQVISRNFELNLIYHTVKGVLLEIRFFQNFQFWGTIESILVDFI